jgi:hypothetical protein
MFKGIVISLGMFGLLMGSAIADAVQSQDRPSQQVKNFNTNHPEIQPGEVFLTNIGDPRVTIQGLQHWSSIEHATKRLGVVGYDKDGRILPYLKPVFVQRSEMEARGMDPDFWEH